MKSLEARLARLERLLEERARRRVAIVDLIQKVRYLLEWMPVCSVGSSGHKRRVAVEEALGKFREDGSLKYAVGVEADLKHPLPHPGQAIQGANSRDFPVDHVEHTNS